MSKFWLSQILGALLMMLMSGCMAADYQVKTEMLYGSNNCHGSQKEPSLKLIKNEKEWSAFFFNTMAAGKLPQPEVPEVDFTDSALLVIDWGIKSSSGYAIKFSENGSTIVNKELKINVVLETPSPGRMHALMLTHPCIVISVPDKGYDNIVVKDQNKKLFINLIIQNKE